MSSLPKPYYEDQTRGIVIYNADCREILPLLPKVDAILTDPPYGIAEKMKGGPKEKGGQGAFFQSKRFGLHFDFERPSDIVEKLPSLGDCIIWGGNYYNLGPCRGYLVWHKPDSLPSFADAELAWRNFDGLCKLHRATIAGTNAEREGHPTQKPLALMKWCLGFFHKAETVLDPFMGSGTTLVACKQLGRKCIGIELEEKYCEIAARRLSQDLLFEPDELAQLAS